MTILAFEFTKQKLLLKIRNCHSLVVDDSLLISDDLLLFLVRMLVLFNDFHQFFDLGFLIVAQRLRAVELGEKGDDIRKS